MAEPLTLPGFVNAHSHAFQRALRGRTEGGDFWAWRELMLVGGYKLVVPRGYEFEVNLLGKAATWLLYASLALTMVTRAGTEWPLWLFWIGLAVAVAAGLQYVVKARREVQVS